MPPANADPQTLAVIRRLAAAEAIAFVSRQARSDLMAYNLTPSDVCEAVVEAIDAGARVKPVTLHTFPGRQGEPAYEVKPKLIGMTWYVKVCIDEPGKPGEGLALLSAHVDH